MDYVTRQFINLTKNFRKEIRKLLSDLHNALQNQTSAIRDYTAATQQRQNTQPPIQISAELHTPENIEGDRARRDNRQYGLQQWLTVGTWLAFIAAAVYAGIAREQLRTAKSQFVEAQRVSKEQFKTAQDASAKQFQIDQRPYVWNSAIEARFDENQRIAFADIYLMDFGKSPAINERGMAAVFVGKLSLAKADNWFKERDKSRLTVKDAPAAILPPGIPSNPLQTQAVERTHSDAIPVADFNAALATDDGLVIVARFEYFDGSGESFYRSDMCWTRKVRGIDKVGNPIGGLVSCEKHNQVN
ncbi:MAG: hypothetical protein WBE52_11525 [Terriglobales bacterium]